QHWRRRQLSLTCGSGERCGAQVLVRNGWCEPGGKLDEQVAELPAVARRDLSWRLLVPQQPARGIVSELSAAVRVQAMVGEIEGAGLDPFHGSVRERHSYFASIHR